MVYRILYVSRNVRNVFNLIEASEAKSKSNSFQEWIFGQAKWACLSYKSLEGGTKVQQNNNWLLL
jgi:hypothetical protein